MQKISVVILTHNNAATIRQAMASVLWCDEILILDDFSSDDTLGIVPHNTAKIYQKKLAGNFAEQRNYALKKAKNEWVLFLDADEVVSPALKKEIENKSQETDKNGFYIPRIDYVWGKKMRFGEFSQFTLLRLAKKSAGQWVGNVHETWEVKGETGIVHSPILHYPFRNASEFLSKLNYYSSLRALELQKKGTKATSWSIILYAFGKFFINYFFKLGVLDGIRGLIHAIMMSFYSFLVRAKLWVLWYEKSHKKNEAA